MSNRMILVTRQSPEAKLWVDWLQAKQQFAKALPLIEIEADYPNSLPLSFIKALSTPNWILVTSMNAIRCLPSNGMQALRQTEARVVAMGKGTAQALKEYAIRPCRIAEPGATSESLLSWPIFDKKSICKQSIVILGGQGGRSVIQQTLLGRGAKVEKMALYRRNCPIYTTTWLLSQVINPNPILYITSQTALKNLVSLIPVAYYGKLRTLQLVVISNRIAQYAKGKGFKQVFNANSTAVADLYRLTKKIIQ